MNKTILMSLAAIAAVILIGGTLVVSYGVNVYNSAGDTQNRYEMKLKDNTSEFDNMWKTIQQSAQIPEAKKNAFKEIYVEYADARTPKSENQLMTWVKESSPNVDLNTYDKLMNVLVGSRQSWTMRQKELVSIAEQHNKPFNQIPTNFLLPMFGFKKIDPKVITSARTEETFRTGQDNDIDLGINKK